MPSALAQGMSLGAATELVAHYWSTQQWRLLYRESTEFPTDLCAFHEIEPPRNALWADPFPVAWKGRRFVLFEECTYRFWGRTTGSRGILRGIEYLGNGQWSRPYTILERPYHLSYPFVFEVHGRHYLLPETQANGTVELYESDDFPWRWNPVRVLLSGIDAVDTTLIQHDGLWWMFTCLETHRAPNRDLHLFWTHDPVAAGWTPHPYNPVVSDVRCARMAGNLIHDGTHWIRPGQDCSAGYGHAVQLRRILELTPTRYREEPAGRLGPETAVDASGVHTFNQAAGLQLCDVRRSVERWRLC